MIQVDVERELAELGLEIARRDQGGQLRVHCPLCPQDPEGRKRDPTLSIDGADGKGKCHRCGWHGGTYLLRKAIRGEPMAVGQFVRRAAPPKAKPTEIDPTLVARLESALWSPDGAEALGYLRGRGFTDAAIRAFRLGYAKRGAVAIPYLVGAAAVGIKYRMLPGRDGERKYQREPGHHHPPFGADALAGVTGRVLVVEGELDAIAGTQLALGLPVVSVPDGATQSIDEVAAVLEDFDDVLLGLDADPKGDEGAQKLAERLGAFRCRRVRWPRKDLSQCLQDAVPRAEIEAAIIGATDYGSGVVRHISAWAEELLSAPGPDAKGKATGWFGLDRLIGGLRGGEVTLLTAGTGQGKSSWTLDLVRRQAERGVASLVCSLELPTKTVARKLLSGVSGKRWDALEADDRKFSVEKMTTLPIYLLDHYGAMPFETLRLVVEHSVRRHGVFVVVVDHLHFALGVRKAGEDERLLIDEASTAVQRMALALQVHVVLVMHPRKISADRDGGTRAPEIDDLKGSSGPAQNADNVARIVRGEKDNRTIFTLLKVRSEVAKLGSVVYRYDPDALRFHDLDSQEAS